MRLYTITILCNEQSQTNLAAAFQTTPVNGGVMLSLCRWMLLKLFHDYPSSSDWSTANITGFGSETDKRDVQTKMESYGLQTFIEGDALDVYPI